ncbi:MAG: hypothetical protein MI867_27640, partial [Pseudomonadales bacterium]|nr:hypothetical protein [Pseudomonadales bacterium]
MMRSTMLLRLLAALLTFALASTAVPEAALAGPEENCAASKLKAAGREAQGLLGCHSKGAKRDTAPDPACLDKAADKFDRSVDKAEAKGGCAMPGNGSDIEAEVQAFADAADTALPHTGEKSSRKCAAAKLKATGKEAKAFHFCHAKAIKREEAVDVDCLDKAGQKHFDAFDKAENKGGCTTTGDAAALDGLVDGATGAALAIVDPVCGDGVTAGDELCDGAD